MISVTRAGTKISYATTEEADAPSSSSHQTTTVAAFSARQSFKKRARQLFDTGNPSDVFIPKLVTTTTTKNSNNNNDESTDINNEIIFDPISAASIQRRRKQRLNGVAVGNAKSTHSNNNNPLLISDQPSSNGVIHQTTNTAIVSFSSPVARVDDDRDTKLQRPTIGNTGVSGVLAMLSSSKQSSSTNPSAAREHNTKPSAGGILVNKAGNNRLGIDSTSIPTPAWHSPWKLSTVLSSHLGWVRCIAMDPHNALFATGSADRTVKIWNLPKASVGASDALQLTLTGHISPVRGLVFSERHPYLFSCAEDKTVKCWDLETNQVIRHYHGHLSGVYAISLHPLLDVLVTGGRDAVARVWDIRSKQQIHVLSGHDHTVSSVITKTTNPQVITSSHDCTVKLWDLAAGKCMTTLTHHSKAIRALTMPSFENTFVSGATDCLKKWQGKDGRLIQSFREGGTPGGTNVIVHTLAVNDDGVLVSGRDDGTMHLFDYKTGYNFQKIQSKVQPGSLQEAENAILTTAFDLTGSRLITGEADKTIKIYKEDESASQISHPVNMKEWRKTVIAASKERY